MRTGILRGLLTAALPVLLGTSLVGAGGPSRQDQSAEDEVAVRIYLEEVDAHLNSLFTTPVHLEIPGEIELRKLTFKLSYPAQFSFQKSHPGYQLSGDQFDIQSRTQDEADGLEVTTISIGAEERLPEGLILYLDFRVAEEVQERMVTVKNQIVRAETVDGEVLPAARVVAEELGVYVLRSDMLPVVACFFYMH